LTLARKDDGTLRTSPHTASGFRLATARCLATALVSLGITLSAGLDVAHAQTPSSEQMSLLQNMPAEERQALMQQFGGGGMTGLGSSTGLGSTSNQVLSQRPALPGAANGAQMQDIDPRTGLPRDNRIKGSELVLIDLQLQPSLQSSTQTMGQPGTNSYPQMGQQTTGYGQNGVQPNGAQPGSYGAAGATQGAVVPGQGMTSAYGAAQGDNTPFIGPAPELKDRTAAEQQRLEELRDRINKRNPYELSPHGVLSLPGFEPIVLAGLTAKEVQQRLALDPAFRHFTVNVTVLRPDVQDAKALKPFGYEMFRMGATAFVPGSDIPVPENYKLGSGDVLGVQLYGKVSQTFTFPVDRDGSVSIPQIGPVSVAGLGFSAAQSRIETQVSQQMIGTKAHVSLVELRSLRVLVLGDAEMPGSYVISALSNVTNALFSSGGVKPRGSLRNIEVRRDGKLVRKLDLYDVLLRGDTSNDVRLETGDVVLVPPVGPTVSVDGEIRRPAIYEMRADRTLGEMIATAGGLTPEADGTTVTVESIGTNGHRSAVTVDVTKPQGAAHVLAAGDIVRIGAVRPVIENGITLAGYVNRPGVYAWRPGIRLSDIIRSPDDCKPRADLHYVLIRREAADTGHLSMFSTDLAAALAAPGSDADTPLQGRDRLYVFDLVSTREQVVEPLLAELRRQGRPDQPAGVVYVDGEVNVPGNYPLEVDMHLSDLVRAGGGLSDSAYAKAAELTSYTVVDGQRRRTDIQSVNVDDALHKVPGADVALRPYDVLSVKTTPEWDRIEQVTLRGEVRFPGKYQIRRGEMLSAVIERAGGFTTYAFPQGAVFTREELKVREREQMDRLAARMESDLAALALQSSQLNPLAPQSFSAGQALLDQLRRTKPLGRLIIDLKGLMAKNAVLDVAMRDGDELIVPRLTQEVSVLGEVQNPTSHLYRPGLRRDELIALSGGVTARADKSREYVVRADGSLESGASGWLGSRNVEVYPGDTVVVPLDAEKMRPLPLWTAVTTIIYNLAIGAAAIARL
jgi:protein involved in polysaccharide export with SLBB domain